MILQFFHNPRCTKSRECLQFLKENDLKFEITNYSEKAPSFEELYSIIIKLDINPIELVRKKEKIWIEKFKTKDMSDNEIIELMVLNPILIERPIVINGKKAVIARPINKVKEII